MENVIVSILLGQIWQTSIQDLKSTKNISCKDNILFIEGWPNLKCQTLDILWIELTTKKELTDLCLLGWSVKKLGLMQSDLCNK